MRIKRVMRYEPPQRKFRLFRVMWERGVVGKGGYSAKVAVSLWPRLFHFERDFNEWRLTILGLSVHRKKNYGGIFV